MSSRLNPEGVLADLLNWVSDASLRLDPKHSTKLQALEGNHIRIVVDPAWSARPKTYSLLVNDGLFVHMLEAQPDPTVIIQGSLSELLRWLTSGGQDGSVEVMGDASVLPALMSALKSLMPKLPLDQGIRDGLSTAADAATAALQTLLEGARNAIQGKRPPARPHPTDPASPKADP